MALTIASKAILTAPMATRTRSLETSEGPAALLSSSEAEVAKLVAQGFMYKEIAQRRGTSQRTVANQLAAVFQKLGIGGRQELMALYAKNAASLLGHGQVGTLRQPGLSGTAGEESDSVEALWSATEKMMRATSDAMAGATRNASALLAVLEGK
jgi:DNA-binding CsgD family transcriptional regulator